MKSVKRILTVLAGVIVVLFLCVLALLGTGPGLSMTASMIGSVASGQGRAVALTDLSGVLGGTPKIGKLTIADEKGDWLIADGIEADIALGRLLTGTVDISRLSVTELAVSRQPVAGNQDAASDTGPPSLPAVTIVADNIFIRSINLAEPFLGEAARLQLTGNLLLRDAPVDLSGMLDVVRIDGTSGEVSAQWKVAPETNELDLDLTAKEPSDGLLARLLNIHGLPAIDIDIAGSGPLDGWDGTLAVSLDGERTVEGDVSLSVSEERQAVKGTLKGYLARLMPQDVAPLFAGDTSIDLDIERDDGRTVRIGKLSAKSALLSLEASGQVLPDDDSVDLRADIAFGEENALVAFSLGDDRTVDVGQVSVRSSLKGSLEKAEWILDGSVRSLSADAFSVENATISGRSSNVNFLRGSGDANLELASQSLKTGQDMADNLLSGSLSASAEAAFKGMQVDISRFDLKASGLDASASGSADLAERSFDLKTQAQLRLTEDDQLVPVLGQSEVKISGQIAQTEPGALTVTNLNVQSQNLEANGNGRLDNGSLEFGVQASIMDLSRVAGGLEGGVNVDLDLSGPQDAPNFDLKAEGAEISVAGKPLEGLSIVARGVASAAQPSANLKVDGRYENQLVSISASLTRDANGAPLVDTLDLTVPGATATGSLNADAAGLLTGAMDVNVTSLAELGPLMLQEGLSGAMSGKVIFAGSDGKQSVKADFEAGEFSAGAVAASGVSVQASLQDLSSPQSVDVSATAATLEVSGTTAYDVKATAKGGSDLIPFSVSARVYDAPLSVEGDVSSANGATTVTLSKASATFRSIPVSLSEPVSLTVSEDATHVETATLKVGSGTVVVSGKMQDQLAFDIAVSQFPIALFESIAPTGLGQSGTLSGKATVSGSASDPLVDYNLAIAGFSVEASRGVRMPTLSVQSSGNLASNTLTTKTQVLGSGVQFNVDGTVGIEGQRAINLRINGNAPLELATLPAADSGVQLEGMARVAMSVTGTAASPVINGTVTTAGADFVESNTSLTVREINATISFDGTTARIVELTGRLGTGGTVSMAGSVGTNPASGLPANISLTVSNGTYTNSEIVTAQFDADLKIEGELLRSGRIGGSISLDRTDISIPDRLPASIPFIDVKHVGASRSVQQQARELEPRNVQASGNGSGGGLFLDISVSSPARIFLRGRGIDAEFGGSVDITGTSSAPRVRGTYSMIRGRIDILTKRFDFSNGTITFAGPLDPTLNFTTTTTRGGTSYSIVVTGTASQPDISFESSPSLPEDEILANLFFGKNLSNLSAVQIAQLANAVASLGGANNRGGILDRLRGFGGLADIDINTDDADGGTSVGVGRYLNDRTYLNVEKGLSGGSGRVTIDLDITDNLKARGEADMDGNSKAGLFFERDY
ncbi:translocation/assembly module TamB domain-containing protein [Hoeflea prorocentri]|uniref:Translocation/assembly module TamB domain-containing protein n=1 Tax=Hoeflea prorocentri TaxID=1922333 RepID=A0A9X3UJR6_9HYPH|nr:translocation/assembly module TamB domain-containing protein [Hoeflea prorocentri]MCY6380404.1 translocation/assembly module TamB domain-containing protein [Hoeflea prorocentri]MDA5398204.1 translocation/assembly module TamB domain-containing protein [Hoeflea prorocentri]